MLTVKERKALEQGMKELDGGKTRSLDEVERARAVSQAAGLKKRSRVYR